MTFIVPYLIICALYFFILNKIENITNILYQNTQAKTRNYFKIINKNISTKKKLFLLWPFVEIFYYFKS